MFIDCISNFNLNGFQHFSQLTPQNKKQFLHSKYYSPETVFISQYSYRLLKQQKFFALVISMLPVSVTKSNC